MINLLRYDLPHLSQFFTGLGEKPFRAQQVMKWIHQRGVDDFAAMTDLSKNLRQILQEQCVIQAPEVVVEQVSNDGTHKWLLKVDNTNHIETVFIPENHRGTLCVSSQVGCALNCSFCSTATQGFNRNLTVAEIIGQVWLAKRRLLLKNPISHSPITNVVMMGMGEPLLNFDAVVSALSIMRHDSAYGLSRRRVTLSTSGVVPAIDRLKAVSDVSLAISLHAPNNPLRNELVPLNKKYPIEMLLEACHRYVDADQKRHVTIEYAMLRDVNDKALHAKELVRLLSSLPCKVNLIPFNPFFGARYERSLPETIQRFSQILSDAGLITTVRKTRGEDIAAACGQLVGQIHDRTKRHQRFISVNMVQSSQQRVEQTK